MQARAQHQCIGFPDVVGGLTRGNLNGSHQRTARRCNAVFRRTGVVGVGSDQARSVTHEIDGLGNHRVVIHVGLADDNVLGIDVVHRNADVIERFNQAGRSEHVSTASRALFL